MFVNNYENIKKKEKNAQQIKRIYWQNYLYLIC